MDGDAAIRFLLDGAVHVVRDIDPATTVLEYLRDHLGRRGTKEGCAEGDCGACTVVVAELEQGAVRQRPINACIRLLPTLDGKALITVESLRAAAGGALHPAQRALVECHGSQCGFCTPGFVMSLYALYRNEREPDHDAICQALSGNLCRCTGYRPILAAARRMYEYSGAGGDAAAPDLAQRLQSIRVTCEKRLAGAGTRYVAPSTMAELERALAAQPEAVVLAGGTDLGLQVTKDLARLPDIVYLGNVAGLARIERSESQLEIGAAVSLTDAFAALVDEYPALRAMTRRFASPPVCNAGTLCGNVANGSPIGDSMPALICLGATVVLRGAGGARTLPLEAFYRGYRRTDLRPGEFLAAVRVPRARPGLTVRCYKVAKRYEQDISAVCGAFAVEVADRRIQSARVCFGGMAELPRRAPACERALVGAEWSPAGVEAAVAALAGDFSPITDFRASAAYRQRVAGNLLRRLAAEPVSDPAAIEVWSHAG